MEWVVDIVSLYLEVKQGIPVFESFEKLSPFKACLTICSLMVALNVLLSCFCKLPSIF